MPTCVQAIYLTESMLAKPCKRGGRVLSAPQPSARLEIVLNGSIIPSVAS